MHASKESTLIEMNRIFKNNLKLKVNQSVSLLRPRKVLPGNSHRAQSLHEDSLHIFQKVLGWSVWEERSLDLLPAAEPGATHDEVVAIVLLYKAVH